MSRMYSACTSENSNGADWRAKRAAYLSAEARIVVMMASSLGEYFAEGGTNPREVRALFVGDRASTMATIVERAIARGEVDPAHVTERAMTLPADLYRYEVLMSLKPVPDDVLRAIVDDVFLPLVQPDTASKAPRSDE